MVNLQLQQSARVLRATLHHAIGDEERQPEISAEMLKHDCVPDGALSCHEQYQQHMTSQLHHNNDLLEPNLFLQLRQIQPSRIDGRIHKQDVRFVDNYENKWLTSPR